MSNSLEETIIEYRKRSGGCENIIRTKFTIGFDLACRLQEKSNRETKSNKRQGDLELKLIRIKPGASLISELPCSVRIQKENIANIFRQ